jgi:peptidyl-prolyl cis-trans isomerase B (cyclophilin B)
VELEVGIIAGRVLSFRPVRRALLLTMVAADVCACGGSGSSSTSKTTASTPASSGSAPCRTVPVPPPKASGQLPAPGLRLDPRRTYTVTVSTNCGTFAFVLDVKHSPKTSASFYYLVKRGFFDGVTFHRVVAGFVIQGGDPTGSGSGGPGYTVIEPPPRNTQYVRGDVAMAKAPAEPSGASGSQFFIVTAANATQSAGLTPDYALFGKVVSGMPVVQRIDSLPSTPPGDGKPTPAVVMSLLTVGVS